MMNDIYLPFSLKLYSFALTRLFDGNWTGMDLYENIKYLSRNTDVFRKTVADGFLPHLGRWFFEEYTGYGLAEEGYTVEKYTGKKQDQETMAFIDPTLGSHSEYRLWNLEDLRDMLIFHGADSDDKPILEVDNLIDRSNELFSTSDDTAYYENLDSVTGIHDIVSAGIKLRITYNALFEKLKPQYGQKIADKIFHDRQLCSFISTLLIEVGLDQPEKWIERQAIPTWAIRAVIARDRGACAECGINISTELAANPQIDHIVPLAIGGTNDLMNLQLLCKSCNSQKGKKPVPVRTSVPAYLSRRK
jgi:hypothetical protein